MFAPHSVYNRFFTLLTIILLAPFCLLAQLTNEYQIKSGYIFNFQKYFEWERENKIDTFRIGVYGENSNFITTLKSMEGFTAKNKPIKIILFNSIADIKYTHILLVTNDRNYMVKDILDLIRGQNTLLITDRCEYQRYVMVNFIYNENSKITFEINSKNLEDNRFKISPKLIILGGSEIDVRKLYLETEKSLINEKEKVEVFEKELTQKKQEIGNMNAKLATYYHEIETLQSNIANQKNELKTLSTLSNEQKLDLEKKSLILATHKHEIEKRETLLSKKNAEINERQQEISKYSLVLSAQKNEIEKRQAIIDHQGKSLITLVDKMKTQQSILYMLIALIVMALTLTIVIFRNYRINQARNLELEKLSIVARETDNAVIIMNEKGEFEWVNEGFTRLYGFNLEQLIQKNGNTLLTASTFTGIKDIFTNLTNNKKSISYESSNSKTDGSKIWTQSTITPILDGNKNIKKIIVIDSDITSLKEAEFHIIEKNEEIQRQSEELYEQTEQLIGLNEELIAKKDKLEEALEKLKGTQSQLVESEKMVILGQLTAGIAHEINNPVNFINSGIEFLKIAFDQILVLLNKYEILSTENANQELRNIEEYKNDIDYKTLLTDIDQVILDIKSGVYRTVEIVKSLRTFSRLDESDLKTIDLHKSISSTLVILKNKYSNRIEIVQDFGKNIPPIECYPGKINQLLLNILVNAIQAIKETGKIFINTKLVHRNEIEIIELTIKDTGSGMSDEVKRKIFEPFFTTKEIGEGTGLGLSISKNIVETHNGIITVDSVINEGTIFTILLPVEFKKKNKSAILEE
jgi:PAS domain S-box-containing protein